MTSRVLWIAGGWACAMALVMAAGPVLADKPSGVGGGKHGWKGGGEAHGRGGGKSDWRGGGEPSFDGSQPGGAGRDERGGHDGGKPDKPGKDERGGYDATTPPDRGGYEGGPSGGRYYDGRYHGYFDDHHRNLVRDYYMEEFRAGHCPPGLAKKHNGCMPPGQAKKWRIGAPLPRSVIYYDLPSALAMQLGMPPAGYRYGLVDGDILLLAIGTGMVVDALSNINW